MKKILIVISAIVGVMALGVGTFYLTNYLNQPSAEDIQKAQKQIETSFNTAEDDMPKDEKMDLREKIPDDLKENHMQAIIHGMSHQKVIADYKWGEYRITQERVERLLEVAELNRNSYTNGEIYVSILTRWSKGDFSKAVDDHNAIWELQHGNIGKATRLMTPIEERKYIERHFNMKMPTEE